MTTNRKHPFFWIVLILAALIVTLYVPVGRVIYQYGTWKLDLGWECKFVAGRCYVRDIDPRGPAASRLQTGDRVLAINGNEKFLGQGVTGLRSFVAQKGQSYGIRIQRGAQQQEFLMSGIIEKSKRNLIPVLLPIFSSLVIFFIAFLIGVAKPEHRFTQLFTITWFSVAIIYMAVAIEPLDTFFSQSELSLYILLWIVSFSPMEIATAYHFVYRFPPGIRKTLLWALIRNFLYVSAGLLSAILTVIRIRIFQNPEREAELFYPNHALIGYLDRIAVALMIFGLIALSCLLVRNFIQIRDVNQRRRLRWVILGILIGTIPNVIFFGLTLLGSGRESGGIATRESLKLASMAGNLGVMAIPLFMGYAIIRERMYDIHVVIRQGLKYLLAKNMLRILIYLPAAILAFAIVKNHDKKITDIIFSNTAYLLLTLSAVIGLKFRNEVANWLDTKFFREAYNSERILLGLIDEIKNINSVSEISKWVTLQVDAALHPKQILMFYRKREKGELALGYSSGDHSLSLRIPETAQFLQVAESMAHAQEFPSGETVNVPDEEKKWLQQLGTHLIVPMNGSNQRLVGLLLLGEKKSEEPYTPSDRKMLESLAAQIAMICENLMLKEQVDQEMRIKRDVLSHLQEQKRNVVKECPVCGRCFDSDVQTCPDDHAELLLTLPVERIVDEKYRLDKLLGRGGMGAVYRATDLRLNRPVAIKILIGSMFGDRMALKRFEREARASAKLNHPNIVTVYDFGGLEGQGAYLVMELLYGLSMRSALKQEGNVHPRTAAEWFHQILEGMKVAHGNGVIHRDLKPENIFLTGKEENQTVVKILDFGLAKVKFLDSPDSRSLTAPGTVLGTLSYMSPEQIGGGEVDERSDIFSLGVMAIEALTGQPPFQGETSSEVAIAILQQSYEVKGDSAEHRHLNEVIQKCIAKNRKNRYSSLEELQHDLIESMRNVPPFPKIKPEGDDSLTAAETHIVM
jgi:hypothetical protein